MRPGRVSPGDRDAQLGGDAEDGDGERLGWQIDAAQPMIAVPGDMGRRGLRSVSGDAVLVSRVQAAVGLECHDRIECLQP